jgi:hypothetical protein
MFLAICTYDLYGPVLNVFDACVGKKITLFSFSSLLTFPWKKMHVLFIYLFWYLYGLLRFNFWNCSVRRLFRFVLCDNIVLSWLRLVRLTCIDASMWYWDVNSLYWKITFLKCSAPVCSCIKQTMLKIKSMFKLSLLACCPSLLCSCSFCPHKSTQHSAISRKRDTLGPGGRGYPFFSAN